MKKSEKATATTIAKKAPVKKSVEEKAKTTKRTTAEKTTASKMTIPSGLNIAVVDVNKIVAKSSKVAALKQRHQSNNIALQNWLANVRQLINNTADPNQKSALVRQYDAEYAKKKEAVTAEYNRDLQVVDKEITSIIEKQAKSEKFDIVFSKSTVVCGGTDITSIIENYID